LVIGADQDNAFQRHLQRYGDVTTFACGKSLRRDSLTALLTQLERFDRVIVSVHGTSYRVNKDFGIPETSMDIVREVAARKPTTFCLFANPYRLARASGAHYLATVVVAYEETDDTQDLVAQVLFGARSADGMLPITASSFYRKGDGREVQGCGRMGFTMPEELGIASRQFAAMDRIVLEGIAAKAYPGAQVLVAVDGQVIIDKAYGSTTHGGSRAVRTDDLYDLASITKVASTTLALMKLVDQGQVDLDKQLGHYLPELDERYPSHARMGLRDILTHQAGLKAYVPFQNRILTDGRFKPGAVSDTSSGTHGIRIAEGLYLNNAYRDSLLTWVLETPVGARGTYLYSDMGYYLLQELIERRVGMPLDRYVELEFYVPLGAATLGYRPYERFAKDRIAPTENDQLFRKRQLQGDVHDQGAALKGGVAGHAGLFGSATDLAKVMQLLLNKGTYGGRRYLTEAVVGEFTKCQFCKPDGSGNRRALGWDRPAQGNGGPTCDCVSYASFGHTGFTGTMVWADPEQGVVYIFLSNRVHPNATENKLANMGIRTRVQEVVHGAVASRNTTSKGDTGSHRKR
jgi:CubicO group peptidase (beta-lactamase class C family)